MDAPSDPPPPLRFHASALALPAGMRDMLPARAALRRRMARAVLGAFEARGYDPIVPPMLEREEVLARGLGARAGHDLVRMLDPDTGEVLALRPDMTPQVARIVAARYADAPLPLRFAYEGSVVRRPRGRARRNRQVAQAGVEHIGRADVGADAEVIATVCEALAAAGVRETRVEIGHAGVIRGLLRRLPEALREDVTVALGQRDRATWARLLDAHAEVARGLDAVCSIVGDAGVLDASAGTLESLGLRDAHRELVALREAAAREGLDGTLLVDLGEARGMGYYTGALFHVLSARAGEPVASGGRYDELLARYGRDLPATGCALDLETVEDALVAHGAQAAVDDPSRVLVVGVGDAARQRATALRNDGMRVATLVTDDMDEARRYAEAHGYARVERVPRDRPG